MQPETEDEQQDRRGKAEAKSGFAYAAEKPSTNNSKIEA